MTRNQPVEDRLEGEGDVDELVWGQWVNRGGVVPVLQIDVPPGNDFIVGWLLLQAELTEVITGPVVTQAESTAVDDDGGGGEPAVVPKVDQFCTEQAVVAGAGDTQANSWCPPQ